MVLPACCCLRQAQKKCVMAWMNEAMLCVTTLQPNVIHTGFNIRIKGVLSGQMNHAIELQCNTKFYYHINCPFQGNKAIIYRVAKGGGDDNDDDGLCMYK